MFLAGCSSLPPNHSADELKQWAHQKGHTEEFSLNKPPKEIYNSVVPCLISRYRHRGFINQHTYSEHEFNNDSGYFAVNRFDDHIYIEVLEILPDNEGSKLRFHGADRWYVNRLVANAFDVCHLNMIPI